MYAVNDTSYTCLSQAVSRFCGKALTNSEYRVLQFIIERTIRFGKDSEKIPYRHFLEGVYSRDGEVLAAPVPGRKQSIIDALYGLQEKGLIARKLVGKAGASFITIIVNKVAEFLQMCALRLSKKYLRSLDTDSGDDGVRNGTNVGVRNDTNVGYEMIPAEERDIEQRDSKPRDSIATASSRRRSDDSIEESIARVEQEHTQRRRTRLQREERFTPTLFKRIYNDAVTEFRRTDEQHRPVSTLSSREAAIFAQSVKNDPFYQDGSEWKAYIHDCILHWDDYVDEIIRNTKGFKDGIPLTPVFNFFLRIQSRYFAPYYLKRKDGTAQRVIQASVDRTESLRRRMARDSKDAAERIAELERTVEQQKRTIAMERENHHRNIENMRQRARQDAERQARERYVPKLTEEELTQALSEDLPTWDEREAQHARSGRH